MFAVLKSGRLVLNPWASPLFCCTRISSFPKIKQLVNDGDPGLALRCVWPQAHPLPSTLWLHQVGVCEKQRACSSAFSSSTPSQLAFILPLPCPLLYFVCSLPFCRHSVPPSSVSALSPATGAESKEGESIRIWSLQNLENLESVAGKKG